MKLVFLLVYAFTLSPNLGECYRVLMVWPLAGPSHFIQGNVLAKGLAEAGHDVTIISPFEDKVPTKNGSYRYIVLTGLFEEMHNTPVAQNLFKLSTTNSPISPLYMQQMIGRNIEKTLAHPNMQQLLKSGGKFDVVVIEYFYSDALITLAHHFGAHLVLFSPTFASPWVNDMVANPNPLSYIPDLTTSFRPEMSFLERAHNLIIYSIGKLLTYGYVLPAQDAIRKKFLPNGPSVYDAFYNCSIILLNRHESFVQAVPLVPNMIPIGGYHVRPPKKLPDDLQKILDDASEGAVYVSMGTNLKSKDMPKEKKDILLKSFGELKQKVLWKWEDGNMPNKSKNVETRTWFPQSDILAHPNVKLFVTHGGFGSITETVYHGKPILVIPVFGDQISNALRAEADGYAKFIDFHDPDWSEARFYSLLRELLDNPRYSKKAQEKSKLFHDRPSKPMDNAIYWIEYVVRTNGAHHLRVFGTQIHWYKYYLLDVIAALVFVSFAIVFISIKGVRFIIRFFVQKPKIKAKQS